MFHVLNLPISQWELVSLDEWYEIHEYATTYFRPTFKYADE